MNKILLIGNVGNDPKLITAKGNKKVTQFTLAITEYSKNEKGDRTQAIQWFNILAKDKKVEALARNLKKGDKVFVEARLVINTYTDMSVKRQERSRCAFCLRVGCTSAGRRSGPPSKAPILHGSAFFFLFRFCVLKTGVISAHFRTPLRKNISVMFQLGLSQRISLMLNTA